MDTDNTLLLLFQIFEGCICILKLNTTCWKYIECNLKRIECNSDGRLNAIECNGEWVEHISPDGDNGPRLLYL